MPKRSKKSMAARACHFAAALLAAGMILLAAVAEAPTSMPHLAGAAVRVADRSGHGSGVHLGRGLVMTAAHVVEEKKSMSVRTDNGMKLDSQVVWRNEDYDLAALSLPADAVSKVAVAPLSCRTPRIGEEVHGIGGPLDLDFTTAWGRIAGGARKVYGAWKTAYVVDMTIAPGMSGGPLFDRSNRVIGIMVGVAIWGGDGSTIAPHSIPFGFVVPSTAACALTGRG